MSFAVTDCLFCVRDDGRLCTPHAVASNRMQRSIRFCRLITWCGIVYGLFQSFVGVVWGLQLFQKRLVFMSSGKILGQYFSKYLTIKTNPTSERSNICRFRSCHYHLATFKHSRIRYHPTNIRPLRGRYVLSCICYKHSTSPRSVYIVLHLLPANPIRPRRGRMFVAFTTQKTIRPRRGRTFVAFIRAFNRPSFFVRNKKIKHSFTPDFYIKIRQNFQKLLFKRAPAVVLFLIQNIFANRIYMRSTIGKCTIPSLPFKLKR